MKSDPTDQSIAATNQLHDEIDKLIHRYSKESDVTTYQVIGMLEVIKHDLLHENSGPLPKDGG